MRAGWPLEPAGDGRPRWMVAPTTGSPGWDRTRRTGRLSSPARTTCPRSSVDRALDYESRGRTFESSRGHSRDMAQFGSAPDWGSGGRRFESGYPDATGTSSTWRSAGFGSRRMSVRIARTRLMEGSAQWWATGLESRAAGNGEGSTPLPSALACEADQCSVNGHTAARLQPRPQFQEQFAQLVDAAHVPCRGWTPLLVP